MDERTRRELAAELADAVIAALTAPDAAESSVVQRCVQAVEDATPTRDLEDLRRSPLEHRGRIEVTLNRCLQSDAFLRDAVRADRGLLDPSDAFLFVSYRRASTADFVRRLADRLKLIWGVALDERSLRNGPFDEQLGTLVRNCAVFVLVIGEGTLERTHDPTDWVRREVETALHAKRPIQPLLVDIDMPGADAWPQALHPVLRYNAFHFDRMRFDVCVDELETWLAKLR